MQSEIIIKEINIKSKFFFAPINTGLALYGNPTTELVNFQQLRSNKYTGISYVGNVAINNEHVTNSGTLFINSSMQYYLKLVKAIEESGSLPGVQIASFNSKFFPQRKWKNAEPEIYKKLIQTEILNLSYHQLKSIIKSFQTGIKRLSELGFKTIQIHGAHGYFLNNFLSKSYNIRDDEFGKDNTLIVKEILDGVNSIAQKLIIDLRVSLFEEKIKPTLSSDDISFLNSLYNIDGIDIISISNGIYNLDKKLIYPTKDKGHAFMLDVLNTFLQSHRCKVWNLSGNIRNLLQLQNTDNHLTFSIGRPIIADPKFVIKSLENNQFEIIECKYRNKCHFFSRGEKHIQCGVNNNLF